MLSVRPFDSRATVTVRDEAIDVPAAIEARVQQIWEAEQARRGRALFNGRIVSARSIAGGRIEATIAEYRQLIAQRVEPDLFEWLGVRPVAVSGLLECADGIVFGRRGAHMTQAGGAWELCPSGGLDAAQVDAGRVYDYGAQMLVELHEELGVARDAIVEIRAFCLVEDDDSHVIDIGIAMRTAMRAHELIAAHARLVSDEYDEIRVIALEDVAAFVAAHRSNLVSTSEALLGQYGLLAA